MASKPWRIRSASRDRPSLRMALRFCELTVCTLRCDMREISVMVAPEQKRRITSASRRVRLTALPGRSRLAIILRMEGEW
ncbi:hypothetical protein AD428_07690 [Achromobacter sp. DMS1]|nr:hypothetical protein AD428_07690 [Achromobacter sp. DMS1]